MQHGKYHVIDAVSLLTSNELNCFLPKATLILSIAADFSDSGMHTLKSRQK